MNKDPRYIDYILSRLPNNLRYLAGPLKMMLDPNPTARPTLTDLRTSKAFTICANKSLAVEQTSLTDKYAQRLNVALEDAARLRADLNNEEEAHLTTQRKIPDMQDRITELEEKNEAAEQRIRELEEAVRKA